MEIELTGIDDFNPSEHKMLPERSFDDFAIGEKFFAPSRTITEGIFTNFQAASGDNHPIHRRGDLRHRGKARRINFQRHIRIGQSDKAALGMGFDRLQMPKANQPAANHQNPFHMTAPICHGTNS